MRAAMPITVLIARTDAIAVEGFDAAIERAESYLEAGADVLFVEAAETREQMKTIGDRFGRRVPLLANMVEGGSTPSYTLEQLKELDFKIALYPGGLARAFAFAAREFFESLKTHGTTEPFRSRMGRLQGAQQHHRHPRTAGTRQEIRSGNDQGQVKGQNQVTAKVTGRQKR